MSKPENSPSADPRGRVLLVEDDLHSALALRRLLEFEGIAADHVTTVEAALCALGRVPYDTIITDLLLAGGESGQELERRLRQTRLILLSGHIRALEKASGFDLVLRKPCDPDVLLQKRSLASRCRDESAESDARETAPPRTATRTSSAPVPPCYFDLVLLLRRLVEGVADLCCGNRQKIVPPRPRRCPPEG